MSNRFTGDGNIGQAPALRVVKVGTEDRSVADLRIFFDRRLPLEDGSFEDSGGFWLTVSLWGHRAESAVKLLSKGMRVHVTGGLRLDTWQDDQDQAHSELRLTAERLSIDPVCLESLKVRKRNTQGPDKAQAEQFPYSASPYDFAYDDSYSTGQDEVEAVGAMDN